VWANLSLQYMKYSKCPIFMFFFGQKHFCIKVIGHILLKFVTYTQIRSYCVSKVIFYCIYHYYINQLYIAYNTDIWEILFTIHIGSIINLLMFQICFRNPSLFYLKKIIHRLFTHHNLFIAAQMFHKFSKKWTNQIWLKC
jgi:hypothetical protein